jgi:hypothetical protein
MYRKLILRASGDSVHAVAASAEKNPISLFNNAFY